MNAWVEKRYDDSEAEDIKRGRGKRVNIWGPSLRKMSLVRRDLRTFLTVSFGYQERRARSFSGITPTDTTIMFPTNDHVAPGGIVIEITTSKLKLNSDASPSLSFAIDAPPCFAIRIPRLHGFHDVSKFICNHTE